MMRRDKTIKKLPEPTAREVFRQVAIGLDGLKQRLIIHRDIKLGNILVSDHTINAEVFIADFGISAKL